MAARSSSKASSFPERPASGPGLAQEVGRVVAHLLQSGQQLEDQSAPGDSVCFRDLGHGLFHHGAIQRGLLGGERDDVVGLGFGR